MAAEKSTVKPRRLDWVYATLPVNIALGPVGTFVQLYLLQLNGVQAGTVYVAAAVTAFNAVSIPAAIIWGFATDRLRKRKLVIVVSYAVTTVFLFSFFFSDSNSGIIFVYSLVSFISAASATPLNLLIMESEQKSRWASGFARLSLVSSVGATIGYVLCSVWVQFLPVIWLVIPFGVLSLVSVAMSIVLVQEPPYTFEREVVVMQRPSFLQRLVAFPLFFLNIPRPSDFRRLFKGIRNELTSYVPLLYLSIILFYLGSGVFNTSFVPALSDHSLTESEVYAVSVAALVAQILAFRYAGRYIANRSLVGVAVQTLLLRGGAYALLGVASLLVPGVLFTIPALIFYPLSSGIAYGIYYTASNTMIFDSVKGSHHGSSLGVYSAVVGVSTTFGSFASGLTSHYLGFDFSFVIAGGLLVAAAFITATLSREKSSEQKSA
ncbi:MAG: MFS transporter [Nitrososphaerota archaeon]|nr:MFS transporter [Nitrososphaerota archaeon]